MRSQKTNVARDLWLAGIPEATIAEQLDLEPTTIERWRDEENWPGLRAKIEQLAARKLLEEGDKCDQMDTALGWALREALVAEIKAGNLSSGQLLKLTSALDRLRRIQDELNRSAIDRQNRLKLMGDHAA